MYLLSSELCQIHDTQALKLHLLVHHLFLWTKVKVHSTCKHHEKNNVHYTTTMYMYMHSEICSVEYIEILKYEVSVKQLTLDGICQPLCVLRVLSRNITRRPWWRWLVTLLKLCCYVCSTPSLVYCMWLMMVEMSACPVIYIVPILVSHFIYVKFLCRCPFLSNVLAWGMCSYTKCLCCICTWLCVVNVRIGRTMGTGWVVEFNGDKTHHSQFSRLGTQFYAWAVPAGSCGPTRIAYQNITIT